MNIEVTEETFFSIFKNDDFTFNSLSELVLIEYYDNQKIKQDGFVMHNHISNVSQYYLTDINA